MWVPCRKCEKCRLFRHMQLRERMMNELAVTHLRGNRSWFVTLTFSPAHLAGLLTKAKGDRGAILERHAYGDVQKYFKRLRKAGMKFRYFAVYELGEETGRSHYHLLMHEVGARPILKRELEGQWHSIVHARLVHMERAGAGLGSYIAKYATKAVTVRPRMSNLYGRTVAHPKGSK